MSIDLSGAHCIGIGCRHDEDHTARFAPGTVAALARRDARRGRHESDPAGISVSGSGGRHDAGSDIPAASL